MKRIFKGFVSVTKACYYAFVLLGLFFLEIDILKSQSATYAYLVFILFLFAVIYTVIDIVENITRTDLAKHTRS